MLHNQLQESGKTASGGYMMFEELHNARTEWQANSNAMAIVLAAPLLLEYKREAIDYAIDVMLLGISAACIVVPFVVPAVAGVAIACWSLRGTSGEFKRK